MTAFPQIPVTAAEIIRQVGHKVYSRGQNYRTSQKVIRYTYDQENRTLSGLVSGSAGQEYKTRVTFPPEKIIGSAGFHAHCSCPVTSNCKHAVALMLTAIERSTKAAKALTAASATWAPRQENPAKATGKAAIADGALQDQAHRLQQEMQEFGVFLASQHPGNQEVSAEEPHQPKLPAWRRTLAHTLSARPSTPGSARDQVSGALDLRFSVPSVYGFGSRPAGNTPQVNVQARPMMMGARHQWIKGGLSWEDFQRDLSRGLSLGRVYPEHERWFAEFYSVVRPWQSAYTSHRDWVSLSSVSSTLLWRVLTNAQKIGLPILLNGSEINYFITAPLDLELTARSTDEGMDLEPTLPTELGTVLAANCHRLGEPRLGFIALGQRAHVAYTAEAHQAKWNLVREPALPAAPEDEATPTVSPNKEAEIVFIPLKNSLSPTTESLAHSGKISVPAEDINDFYADFYPQLTRSINILTSDPAIHLPVLRDPTLVLTVAFDEQAQNRAHTWWEWEYPTHPMADPETPEATENTYLSALGYPGEDHPKIRDPELENTVYKTAKTVRPGLPFTRHTVEGWDVRDLLQSTIPAYSQLEHIRVDLQGTAPVFTERSDTEIEVTVERTGDRDWFGLGIAIKVGQWYVPFAKIFEALNADKTHMLLGDGSYFSLDRPDFRKLADLIREAQSIDDKTGPLRISRHQAGLFKDLEELAASVDAVNEWQEQVGALLALENQPLPPVPQSLNATLRPYQLEGYQWLTFCWENHLGGVLADDMGLGKTIQAIALMSYAKESFEQESRSTGSFAPFLVVAPTSVVPNWESEIARFAPQLKVAVINETTAKSKSTVMERTQGADVIVTSYALFRMDEEEYVQVPRPFNALVLDEAQFVKNPKTKAHRTARDVPARYKLAITGTPLENNLMELWSMLSIVAPGLFPSARTFKDYFAAPIESGEESQGILEKLRSRVRPLMKRRTKELVAPDLPEKTDQRVNVPLAPAHRRAYDMHLQRERQKILGLLEDLDKNRFTIFQSLTTLRRLALDASLIDEKYATVPSSKLDYLEENLPEIMTEGHRALIFSQFTSYLKKIGSRLDELGIPYLYLDGSTRNRAEILADFKGGKAPVFLISLKAGGFGLNLTEADYCFIMDPWWNPAAEAQAIDRIHRIGQTKNVMVYRLVSAGTIEEKVMELKEGKAALFDAVVDEGQFFSSQLSAEQVRDLLTQGQG